MSEARASPGSARCVARIWRPWARTRRPARSSGAHVPDLGAKEALLTEDPDVYFTTPHFDGYSAILVRLEEIDVADLEELIVEAWLARAPKRLAKAYLAASG